MLRLIHGVCTGLDSVSLGFQRFSGKFCLFSLRSPWLPSRYGTGAALFGPVWGCLARAYRTPRMLAIDPLGTGLSSRPEWTAAQDTAKAEAFFVDSLEEWREAQPAPPQSTTYQRDGWREKRRGR